MGVDRTASFHEVVRGRQAVESKLSSILPPIGRGPTEFDRCSGDAAILLMERQRALAEARPRYLDVRRTAVFISGDGELGDVDLVWAQQFDDETDAELAKVRSLIDRLEELAGEEADGDSRRAAESFQRMRSRRLDQLAARQSALARPYLRVQQARLDNSLEEEAEVSAKWVQYTPDGKRTEVEPELNEEDIQELSLANQELLLDLNAIVGASQQIERQINEISKLQTDILAQLNIQNETLEQLSEDAENAVASTLEGNKELQGATSNSSFSRKVILIFLIVASLSLLLVHWHN